MICSLVYRRYAKAAGVKRIGSQLQRIFNRAMAYAVHRGMLVQQNEHGTKDQRNKIVRQPHTPEVVVRKIGERRVEEVPPFEIVAFMDLYRRVHNVTDRESLIQKAKNHYGVLRMSEQTKKIFEDAFERLPDTAIS